MKKILLAILVVALAVSCFAMVFTASAATTDASAADTLAKRGYLKHGDEYYKVAYKQDFEDVNVTNNPVVYGDWYRNNGFDSMTTLNGSTMYALTIPAASTASRDNRGLVHFNTMVTQDVMTYIQMDIYTTASDLWIWTSAYWHDFHFNGGVWESLGFAEKFNKVEIAENTWRISFFVNYATYSKDADYKIETQGDGATQQIVAFDNIIVAPLDAVCAPWVTSDTISYTADDAQDVQVNLDTKGKAITSVTLGGAAVDSVNYSYAGETLTLAAAAFDDMTDDMECVVTTEGGTASFTVKYIAGKPVLTASLVSTAPINKYYDGTTEVKQDISVQLSGVEAGHEVVATCTAVYDNAAAGTGRKIIVTVSLTGKDVALYKLGNTTLEITDCEIFALIPVTVSHTGIIEKYEDGTTDVPDGLITLTLTGVEQGDDVSVTFGAAYVSATAGDDVKINVTNMALTGDHAYKYTLDGITSLQINGKIIARTSTTASYDGVIEKRYDGTNFFNLKDFTLTLSSIAERDEVTATFDAVFDSKEVGKRTVTFTNITLTGKDAHKYKLDNNNSSLVVTEAYILEMKDIAVSDDKGYFTLDGQTLQTINFDNDANGSLSADSVSGLYIASFAGFHQEASIVSFGDNNVLKIATDCDSTATQFFATNQTSQYRDAGVYAVSYKVKPESALFVEVVVRSDDGSGILARCRLNLTNDASGKAIAANNTAGNQKYIDCHYDLDANGWISCYFDFNVPARTFWDNQWKPNVTFYGASPVAREVSTYYFDDIKYICKSASNKYMTIDHNYDFEGTAGEVTDNTPFYSSLSAGFTYDDEWLETGDDVVLRLDIPAYHNDLVGAIKNGVANGALKLLKGTGLHYVQFDFDTTCAGFNLFAPNYFDIQCTRIAGSCVFNLEVYATSINNFKTQLLDNGMTRVSFLLDMTGIPYDGFYLNLKAITSNTPGEIYFDNLFVAHEDYTPLAQDTSYNLVGDDGAVFDVDLKGARLTGLQLDGVAVDARKYVYNADNGTITLDRDLLEANNALYNLTILTSEGNVNAKATLYDNRAEVTLTLDYTGDPIAKDYDGTTDVEQAIKDAIEQAIAMSGVTGDDEVSLSYDIAYSSKNAGSVTIQITNIVLTGAQAGNYKLGTTSLSVDATINKLQLTVDGTTANNKTYDGNTTATASAGTLSGVLGGEDVTLTVASATFNSKDVADANKVTVVYALQGDDAINYIVPVTEDIENVTISKKAITVTADAKSMTVGASEPALTYKVTGMVDGETLSGALTREEGTEAGEYDILQGTVDGANYEITYVSAKLTINEAQGGGDPSDDPSDDPTEPDGLTPGAIAGIVIGCAVVAGGAALAVVFILKKKRLSK